jgi:hypothetical protein
MEGMVEGRMTKQKLHNTTVRYLTSKLKGPTSLTEHLDQFLSVRGC